MVRSRARLPLAICPPHPHVSPSLHPRPVPLCLARARTSIHPVPVHRTRPPCQTTALCSHQAASCTCRPPRDGLRTRALWLLWCLFVQFRASGLSLCDGLRTRAVWRMCCMQTRKAKGRHGSLSVPSGCAYLASSSPPRDARCVPGSACC